MLDKLVIRYENASNPEFDNQLDVLRNRIDAIDAELLEILASRVQIVKQIGEYKRDNNVTALQISRWTQLMENRVKLGKSMDVNETFVKILFQLIHEDSVRMQTEIMDQE
jgi:chorismate mutase